MTKLMALLILKMIPDSYIVRVLQLSTTLTMNIGELFLFEGIKYLKSLTADTLPLLISSGRCLIPYCFKSNYKK